MSIDGLAHHGASTAVKHRVGPTQGMPNESMGLARRLS